MNVPLKDNYVFFNLKYLKESAAAANRAAIEHLGAIACSQIASINKCLTSATDLIIIVSESTA